jgi:acyl-CoA thioesterase FadM
MFIIFILRKGKQQHVTTGEHCAPNPNHYSHVVGYISPWRLARLGEAPRMLVCSQLAKLENFFEENMIYFVMAGSYDIKDGFYEKEHYYGAVYFHVFVADVGNSSLTFGQHLYSSNGVHLSTITAKIVRVNIETRRPIPISPEYKEYLQKVRQSPFNLGSLNPLSKPEGLIPVKRTVVWSNMDLYRHTNQAVYIQYCMDAIMDASKRPEYSSQLPKDIAAVKMRTMHMLYLGETVPGDALDIYVWTEPDNKTLVIKCIVEKRGKPVFHFRASFANKPNMVSKL